MKQTTRRITEYEVRNLGMQAKNGLRKQEGPRDPSRRKFVKGLLATGAALTVASAFAESAAARPVSQVASEMSADPASKPLYKKIEIMDGKIPLIDVHSHLLAVETPDSILRMMNNCAVSRVVLMPRQSGQAAGEGVPDNYVFKFYEKDPERIIPLVGMMRDELMLRNRWLYPDASAQMILSLAESQLKTGIIRGIGEVIVRHYEYPTPDGLYTNPDVDNPIDSPFFYSLLDLAEKYDVPIDIHLEIDSKTMGPFETVLQKRPNAKIILAHCGRGDPETLKRLLGKYRNLYVEASCNMATQAYGQLEPPSWVKNPHEDGKGNLLPEFKKFYEEFADRIMGVGTDFYRPTGYQNNQFVPTMNRWRQLLWNNISESAMRKIAYKNAEKIYLGMDW